MNNSVPWKDLLSTLQTFTKQKEPDYASAEAALRAHEPADIALALEELEDTDVQKFFAMLDDDKAAAVLGMLSPVQAKNVAGSLNSQKLDRLAVLLPKREAASVISSQSKAEIRKLAKTGALSRPVTEDAVQRSKYPDDEAGHLMTTEFIRLRADMTVSQVLDEVRKTDAAEDVPDDMCVIEDEISSASSKTRLIGIVSIREAVMSPPEQPIHEVMETAIVCVTANTKSLDAARLLSKHKFMALPVTDDEGFLLGLIPGDDLMIVALARMYQRYTTSVGTDAAAMEKLSPFQAAVKRAPWLLGTMVIELGAAAIVAHFNPILQKVILLASFMPVISAVSGNVGLQAAAITVRSLDVEKMSFGKRGAALAKEGATTLFMAVVCGLVLGSIGALWSSHFIFGVVIGLALTCSMLTAAFMGTIFPMVSKSLGFDPAATAGPFETAFQDVIGFGVFLGLATLFANRI